jgi:hypothetical protein
MICKTLNIVILLSIVTSGCVEQTKPIMYGSYTCTHCIHQKTLIKASDYTYIECNLNTSVNMVCIDAHIEAYPTWVFPDGSRREGEINQSQFDEMRNT